MELRPRRPADGGEEVLRFCHNARERADFLGQQWRPGVVALPETETDLGFDGRNFGQGAVPQVGRLRLAHEGRNWPALVWKNAAGTLRTAPLPDRGDPADAAFGPPQPFRVEAIEVERGEAVLTLIDSGRELTRPVINRLFGTTGVPLLDGADTIDLRGRPVPVGQGRLLSVPGYLVDRANNIWLFLGNPATSQQGFYDGGQPYANGVARVSLAALQANTPADGTVDWCLDAAGLVLARPWTRPNYPFTADLSTATVRAADIAALLVSARTSLAFAPGTVAAFNALYPAECGLYVDDERTVATALDQLVAGLGGYWRLTSLGQIALGRLAHAAPVLTLSEADLVSIERRGTVMPTRRRAVGWARNNRVHGEGEIAAAVLAGMDGTSVAELLIWRRSATPPGTPSGGSFDFGTGVLTPPTGWSASIPATDGNPAYASRGQASISGPTGVATPSWAAPTRAIEDGAPGATGPQGPQGPQGVPGQHGTSVAEVNVYRRASSQPATPSGGSFDFSTATLTAPSGWSVSIPSGSDPVWVSRGVAVTNTPGGSDVPDWSTPARAFEDGSAVDAIFRRATSQPATPSPSSGVPSGWYSSIADVPSGAGTIWTSFGTRASPALDWVWETPVRIEGIDGATGPQGPQGPQGVPGQHGTSVAEVNVYRRASSQPATPSGGSFDFSTATLTAPSGWSVSIPSGSDPVWVSRGVAVTNTPGGSDVPDWSTPARAFEDGSAVDAIFRRATSQPATPSPSSGVPSGWYSSIADVPSGAGTIWTSFGTRASPALDWVWETPVRIEGIDGATGPQGPQGPQGPTGPTGATGVSTRIIFRRSGTQPSTPSPSSGVPSGWYGTTGDVPSSADPMWASTGERPSGGSDYSWGVPVRHEAITAANTGDWRYLTESVSGEMTFTLQPGESRIARGMGLYPSPVSPGSVRVQIEYGEVGGGWTTSNGASAPFNVGEPGTPLHSVTITNSTGAQRPYRVRGTLIIESGDPGTRDANVSVLAV
ncbi:hypothetical protein [Thermaurantiacus tibetensis]|uniref:hypothetical protein n=1 Tax=Thermaurantiacus tibetensis TaxID=2759035 RepID=UPI0018908B38|nr:hypothetical protein [Thermaurantiacus tibetensis]